MLDPATKVNEAELESLERAISKAATPDGKITTLYSPMHVNLMAMWKIMQKVARKHFKRWYDYERSGAAASERALAPRRVKRAA
jgi:hypothetical protein